MADKDVTISFRTEADLAAAGQTDEAIKDVGKSAENASAQTAAAGDAGSSAMDGITKEAETATKAMREAEAAAKDLARASGGGETTGFGDNGRAASEKRAAAAEAQRQSEAATRAKENEAKATRQLTDEERELADAQKDRAEQAKRDVEDAKARRAQREEQQAQAAGADDAAVARGGAYAAAVFASIKLADNATQEFLGNLQKAGIDLDKLRETNPGDFLWVDMLQNVSNPLQAIKDFVSTGFANLAGLDDLQKSAEQSVQLAAGIERAKQQAKLYAEVDNRIRIAALETELRAVDAVTAALERKIRVERSARELAEAQARSADEEAVRGGADPNVVAARAAARQGEADIAALNENLALALRGVDAASARVAQADAELSRINQESGANSLAAAEAFTSLIKAKDSLATIAADAKALEQETANKTAQIMVGVQDAFTTAGLDIPRETATKARALVESVAGAGSELSALQQDAKARVDAILADGKIVAGETAAFQQALSQLLGGIGADMKSFQQIAAEGNAIIAQNAGALEAIKQEQARLRAQVNQLSGR